MGKLLFRHGPFSDTASFGRSLSRTLVLSRHCPFSEKLRAVIASPLSIRPARHRFSDTLPRADPCLPPFPLARLAFRQPPPLPQNFPSQSRRHGSGTPLSGLSRHGYHVPFSPGLPLLSAGKEELNAERGCPFGTSPSVISVSAWRPDAPFQSLSCRRDLCPACRRQRHPSHFPKETLRHDTGISAWLHGYGQWLW